MYLFSCAAVLLISHYSIKRPSGNVHLRQDIMRLPNVMGSREEAMTAINIPDAGPQMTYRVSQSPNNILKLKIVRLKSQPNFCVFYAKFA